MKDTTKAIFILLGGNILISLATLLLQRLTGLDLFWATFVGGIVWGYGVSTCYFKALDEEENQEKD